MLDNPDNHSDIYEGLRSLLDGKGITSVAIIDDAYNKVPSLDQFGTAAQEQLVSEIHAATDVDNRLKSASLSINSVDDLEEPNWSQLWNLAESDPQLKALLMGLNLGQNQGLKTLEGLSRFMEGNLGRTVQKLGTDAELPDTAASLIFIDYYLDERGKQESLTIADVVGSRIKQLYRLTKEKPLIVLMSSREGISIADKNAFRESATFVGGMFHFIGKQEFQEEIRLAIWLALITNTLKEGRTIQQFVDDLSGAAGNALEKFTKKLRAFSVDDFAYIQRLTLEKEGQPLSDYVLHLLSSYFSQLLRSAVTDDQDELNDLVFEELAYTGE